MRHSKIPYTVSIISPCSFHCLPSLLLHGHFCHFLQDETFFLGEKTQNVLEGGVTFYPAGKLLKTLGITKPLASRSP